MTIYSLKNKLEVSGVVELQIILAFIHYADTTYHYIFKILPYYILIANIYQIINYVFLFDCYHSLFNCL